MGDNSIFEKIETDPKAEAQFAIWAFSRDGSIINARVAWLRCEEAGVTIPEDVEAVVMGFIAKGIKDQVVPVDTYQNNVLEMLYIFKENHSLFLEITNPHHRSKDIVYTVYPVQILEPILYRLKTKKYTDPQLYILFGELLNIKGNGCANRVRKRYGRYKEGRNIQEGKNTS